VSVTVTVKEPVESVCGNSGVASKHAAQSSAAHLNLIYPTLRGPNIIGFRFPDFIHRFVTFIAILNYAALGYITEDYGNSLSPITYFYARHSCYSGGWNLGRSSRIVNLLGRVTWPNYARPKCRRETRGSSGATGEPEHRNRSLSDATTQ